MLNRRDVMTSAGVLAATLVTQGAFAHDHSAMGMDTANGKVIDTASTCIKSGEACLAHCLASFASGDTKMAACAKTVDVMLSTCATLQKLAAAGSAYLPEMAKLALAVCQDCEKECRKHEQEHAVCKTCAESCAACAEECKKLAA